MPAFFSPDTFILVSAPLTSVGAGYTSVPSVNVTGTNGEGAAITAVLTPTAVNATFTIVSGGRGYVIAPSVRLVAVDDLGSGATATCAITAGAVSSVTLGASGTGYTQPPLVAFDGPGDGTGAAATSLLVGTTVASLRVMRGGQGYSETPRVVISGGGFTTAATCLVPVISSLSTVGVPRSSARRELNKAPLIQAPAWAASAAVIVGVYRRHTNGQLMGCVAGGTTGATIPTWIGTAPMADSGATWVALGRMARLNTDGYEVPVVTAPTTAPGGLIETQLLSNSTKVLTATCQNVVSNQAGNTTAAWQWNDGGVTNTQGIGAGLRGINRTTVFRSDAPVLAVSMWSAPNAFVKIWVDDYPLEESPTPGPNSTPGYLAITWAQRKEREYRIEISGGANLRGILVGAQDTLYAPPLVGPLGVWTGDSYGTTVSTYNPLLVNDQLPQLMARKLGIRYLRNFSAGGMGYSNAGGTAYAEAAKLLANPQVNWAADVVLCMHGINDAGLAGTTPASNAAAALNVWKILRTQYPNAVIIVGDPWSGSTGPNAAIIALSAALQGTFAAWADPLSGFIGSLTEGWITGTGKWGSVTGSGNADFYIGADAVHPSTVCVEMLAQRIAQSADSIMVSFGR